MSHLKLPNIVVENESLLQYKPLYCLYLIPVFLTFHLKLVDLKLEIFRGISLHFFIYLLIV